MTDAEGVAACWGAASQTLPEGKSMWWVDDHQGGGFVEYVTDIEYARRMKILDTIDEDGNGEERIDWE